MRAQPPACCRCCDNATRARQTLAMVTERGDDPSDWWCAYPENVCSCPSRSPEERCSCAHCLSWLRRAPRCRRPDCWAYAWVDGVGDCLVHREERRERQRQTSARSASIRKPPRPPHELTAGACSMCGTSPLPGRRRSWCSDECVELWNIASSGQAAYSHLVQIQGPACWGCDATMEPEREHHWSANPGALTGRMTPVRLEVEHVRPLWSLTDHERTEFRWWLPYNLQLLCTICHRAKSKREAGERAALRRAST